MARIKLMTLRLTVDDAENGDCRNYVRPILTFDFSESAGEVYSRLRRVEIVEVSDYEIRSCEGEEAGVLLTDFPLRLTLTPSGNRLAADEVQNG